MGQIKVFPKRYGFSVRGIHWKGNCNIRMQLSAAAAETGIIYIYRRSCSCRNRFLYICQRSVHMQQQCRTQSQEKRQVREGEGALLVLPPLQGVLLQKRGCCWSLQKRSTPAWSKKKFSVNFPTAHWLDVVFCIDQINICWGKL